MADGKLVINKQDVRAAKRFLQDLRQSLWNAHAKLEQPNDPPASVLEITSTRTLDQLSGRLFQAYELTESMLDDIDDALATLDRL